MSKILELLVVLVMGLAVVACVVKVDQVNSRHGRVVYRNFCGSCPIEGGEAKPLDTRTRTMDQWRRYFEKDRHRISPAAWDGLSDAGKRDVLQYVIDYAADSDPAKCGSCWDTF